MIYSVQQMGRFSLNKNCSKVQPGKMQPFVRQPLLPAFLFFQSIRENVIVDSHQTLIQYFCTNVFFLFVCPIINLSKNGKNCIANLRFFKIFIDNFKSSVKLRWAKSWHK